MDQLAGKRNLAQSPALNPRMEVQGMVVADTQGWCRVDSSAGSGLKVVRSDLAGLF
jgi:hypothetical protein